MNPMKTETISIKFDAAKTSAIRHYAEKKGVKLDDELAESVQNFYEKVVPKDVRLYIDATAGGDGDKPRRPPRAKEGGAS